ncbi:DEAD/DEAH box helicase [Accumulibacter sp.]|uniref:DEAD/DEAH box helicase n=1 Tax=Accumulibacter sp. TaxID=2053492 RepID=UPI0035ADE90A
MKFTLKDYQTEAVRDALSNLKKARRRWHEDGDKHAFSLTAVTGAGKTVMAAAVFEALFHGDDEYDFDADPGAVVIWFSDDPALNEQTRFRLLEASDRIQHTDLVVVENSFNRAKFDARKIYFLNTQKLGKNSLLVRGFEGDETGGLFPETRPDLRSHTIWDTIRNTVEDPALTLYLVLDEAHRGMGSPTKAAQNAKATIVLRLINGAQGVPGIPVVWGISATVERFNQAMAGAHGRGTLPNVVVDAQKVQESGLLKDTIILDIPDEAGRFDTVIVRRAADQLKTSTQAWAEYAKQQGDAQLVVPLMVLQVPNTPDPKDIGQALATIFQQWSDLPSSCVAHVFGEHSMQQFGPYKVPYVSPERVQDAAWVRVLVAKDAISTGWDCPRAEVMVSFRAAMDRTHITQLLGRMVRTPLARRIPGNEQLNSVHCLLPLFDAKTVSAVADALMKGGGGDDDSQPPTGRVLVNPTTMHPNPAVPDAVWTKFESLASQTRPQRGARPPRRLTALAHELAWDGLMPDAGKKAHAEMHKVLDAAQARWRDEIATKRDAVIKVEGQSLVADLKAKSKSFNQFWEEADMAVIDDAFRRAARVITPDIARTYTEALARQKVDPDDTEEYLEALVEARVDIAALGLIAELQPYLDSEADKLAKAWLAKHRVDIKALSHDRQEAYRQVREMSSEPQDVDLVKPEAKDEPAGMLEHEKTTPLPTWRDHLLCDEQGNFPAELNSWEKAVIEAETKRAGFSCWYRNPQQPGQSSLGVAYLVGDQYKIVRPDFVFFAVQKDGAVVADIVDPHGYHLSDALPKLQGLAEYAASHIDAYRRIESIADVDKKLRVLDLTREEVRKGIADAQDVVSLYRGNLASDYL